MSGATGLSVMLSVVKRNLMVLLRTPALLLPALLFPVFFLVGFVGALSSITELPDFGFDNYTAFVFVFVLLQSAALTGASGGLAMAEDFESRFLRRVMLAAPNRVAIVAGYVIAMLLRGVLVAAVLTLFSFLLGLSIDGSPLEILGLIALAVLLNVAVTLWSTGVALHVRSLKAAPGMFLPVFLLLFLTPVYVPRELLTGWLRNVANVNPLTRLMEAGRGFIAGQPADASLAFGLAVGLVVLTMAWAYHGLRRAEAMGG